MGPYRTAKTSDRNSEASSSKAKASSERGQKKHIRTAAPVPSVPGVQKIKAALRQTRRLLAKDKLAADVRIVTERKQKALEAELVVAERARRERTLAQRYHKVKFFERQKLSRKLKQTQRQIELCSDKKKLKKLEKILFELRVDLNYILHYPKLKKYISLFPPEARQQSEQAEKGKAKETDAETATTDKEREELRADIRARMKSGELSLEPEIEHPHAQAERPKTVAAGAPQHTSRPKAAPDIGKDAFFGQDSEEEDANGDEDDEDAETRSE